MARYQSDTSEPSDGGARGVEDMALHQQLALRFLLNDGGGVFDEFDDYAASEDYDDYVDYSDDY